MPQNCSTDVIKVIDYMDGVLHSNDTTAKTALKAQFGLEGVEHDDDFMSVLEWGPWEWQSIEFFSGPNGAFFEFCDAVENTGTLYNSTTVPGAEGVGLEKALSGYAKWIKEEVVPYSCASYGYDEWTSEYELGCFDTYNSSSPFYLDKTVDNPIDLQWEWFLCNEPFSFWQDGAPENTSSIVSRLVSAEYWQRQCADYFPGPGTYGSAEGKTVGATNAFTQGWNLAGNTTRLIWTNGQFDPWKDATVSSDYKPGGPFNGTADAPVQVIPAGVHCSDLITEAGEVNAGVKEVQDNEIAQIKTWVDEFYTTNNKKRAVRRRW